MNRKQLKNLDKARKAQQDQLNENKKQKKADSDSSQLVGVEFCNVRTAEIPDFIKNAYRKPIRELPLPEETKYLRDYERLILKSGSEFPSLQSVNDGVRPEDLNRGKMLIALC